MPSIWGRFPNLKLFFGWVASTSIKVNTLADFIDLKFVKKEGTSGKLPDLTGFEKVRFEGRPS